MTLRISLRISLMKKTYEKPIFVRKGKLSTVVAAASVVVNGAD